MVPSVLSVLSVPSVPSTRSTRSTSSTRALYPTQVVGPESNLLLSRFPNSVEVHKDTNSNRYLAAP